MSTLSQTYQFISNFFSTYALPQATLYLSSSLKAAGKKKIWQGRSPADLLFFYDYLQQLLTAAFLLMEETAWRQQAQLIPITKEHNLLTNYASYCGWHIHSTPWQFFPRHLSKKEFHDPYSAIKKITRARTLTQWKKILQHYLTHALSPTPCTEFHNSNNILTHWLLLHKLIESTHLIDVRAILEDEDGPRPKWKNPNLKSKPKPKSKNKTRKHLIKQTFKK